MRFSSSTGRTYGRNEQAGADSSPGCLVRAMRRGGGTPGSSVEGNRIARCRTRCRRGGCPFAPQGFARGPQVFSVLGNREVDCSKSGGGTLPHLAAPAQDLQFLGVQPTIRNRNRPAKQVGGQRWLNLHSLNRGSTRQSVLCAVSASPECLMNRGELHRLRTGSPAHCSRPRGPAFYLAA